MKINVQALVLGALMAMAVAAITYAYTVDMILNSVYIPSTQSLRIKQL